ncbi:MAG: DUF4234 domain-containing protein [Actinomycetota bacterium]|nr:DUF4234 domain-containing protein [Actinomycetota bacterium]
MTAYSIPLSDTAAGGGPLGVRRDIGKQILLSIVTLGLYALYWAYISHEEIRQHTADGVGGVVGVLIYVFASPVTLFLLPIEIKRMYERDGRESPVQASTAFWFLVFGVPWFVKCQRAMNDYWAAKGAPAVS